MADQKWLKEYRAAQTAMRAEQRRQFTNGMLVGAAAVALGLLLGFMTWQALKTPQTTTASVAKPQTCRVEMRMGFAQTHIFQGKAYAN